MQAFKMAAASVLALAILAGAFFVYASPSNIPALITQMSSIGASAEDTCDKEEREYARVTVRPLLLEWTDAVTLASNSSRMSLAPQIATLQAIRRKVQNDKASLCALGLSSSLETMMDTTIDGFVAFLGDEDDRVVEEHFAGAARMMDYVSHQLNKIENPAK